jgi:predicted amidohydrolase
MKVSIFQGPDYSAGVPKNLDTMAEQLGKAGALGSDLIIFSEMFTSGYNIGRETTHRLAEVNNGATAEFVIDIARKSGIAVLYGYPERDRENIYNSAQLIDAAGQRSCNYRKTHLFGDIERSTFAAGDCNSPVFELNGMKMGVLICYDVEFAENVRSLAMAGADFVAVPTALMHPYSLVPEKLIPTRAYENQVFVAYANRCDIEQELDYTGLSCIVGPDGSDLARAGKEQTLITASLDLSLLQQSRSINTQLADRRPSIYAHESRRPLPV